MQLKILFTLCDLCIQQTMNREKLIWRSKKLHEILKKMFFFFLIVNDSISWLTKKCSEIWRHSHVYGCAKKGLFNCCCCLKQTLQVHVHDFYCNIIKNSNAHYSLCQLGEKGICIAQAMTVNDGKKKNVKFFSLSHLNIKIIDETNKE